MISEMSWDEVRPSAHPFSYDEKKLLRQLTAVVANNGDGIKPWTPDTEAEQFQLRAAVEGKVDEFFVSSFGAWTRFWRDEQVEGGFVSEWHGVRSVLTNGYSSDEAEQTAKSALAALTEWRLILEKLERLFPQPDAVQTDAQYLVGQWQEVFVLVETLTNHNGAWSQTTRQFLKWFLEACGLDSQQSHSIYATALYSFASWSEPSSAERDEDAEALFVLLDDVLKSK